MDKTYQVLKSASLSFLVDYVNRDIKRGWQCQGGVSAIRDEIGSIIYMQAMIKEE